MALPLGEGRDEGRRSLNAGPSQQAKSPASHEPAGFFECLVVELPCYPNHPLKLIRDSGEMVGLGLVLGDMPKSRHRFDSSICNRTADH